jgi:Fibronectin type III domain
MIRTPRRYGHRIVRKLVASACVLVGCAWLAGAATWSNLNATTTGAANTFSAASDWRPAAPTAVTTTPGDGKVAVSWTAPASSGSSTISGYTATASPSGQTCSTTGATSCTITGLTDGLTQSITVTATNPYGTGSASSAASATAYPASLFTAANGISLWLDGADSSTLASGSNCTGSVSGGGSVGCWKDKSGVGENFTQPASGSQPVLDTLNGLGAIDFTSVGQILNSINSSDTYQTVFLAVQPQATASGWEMFFGQAGSDYSIRQAGGSSGVQFSSPNSNDWAYNTGTTPLDWSNGLQATGPSLGATSIITDQAVGPHSFSTSVSSSFAANGYTRGMLGDVGEVIAFSDTLTTAQRRTVEDYLARKWGTTITPDPPGTPTVTAGTASSATVAWAAPAYNGGSPVTGYTVTASPGGQTCTTSGATSCTVTGLTNGTSYTFTVTAANSVGTGPSSPSSAAADWVAPTASASAIGRSGAYDTGFIEQAATYYVYANVTDTGSPASGVASVTADVHTITSGSTAVAMTSGSYTAAGTPYNYRSAALTAANPLATGNDAYTVTAIDKAGNSGTQSFTTSVDNTAPTAVDVQSTNVSGGTVGHLDQGDTLKLTYSGTMDPYSILAGWTGATTNVQIALVDGGGTSPDSIYVYNTAASPAQIPVGIVTLGSASYLGTGAGNYIVYGATGSATPSTMTRNGSVITLVFGVPNGTSLTSTTKAAMIWTPSTSATDIAGNANTAAAATESGTVHVNF